MGAFYDYFRAPDVAVVEQFMTESGDGAAGYASGSPGGEVDMVHTKIEYALWLGQLVALAADVEYDLDLIQCPTVWEEDDEEGMWVVHLDSLSRDRLADVSDDAMPDVAQRWAQIEEFGAQTTGSDLFPIVSDLARLARRARSSGDQLYCRVIL